jgi:hypothetical protein
MPVYARLTRTRHVRGPHRAKAHRMEKKNPLTLENAVAVSVHTLARLAQRRQW